MHAGQEECSGYDGQASATAVLYMLGTAPGAEGKLRALWAGWPPGAIRMPAWSCIPSNLLHLLITLHRPAH